MDLCVCGETAKELLGRMSRSEMLELEIVDESDVLFSNLSWRESRDLSRSIWGDSQACADILVRNQRMRRKGKEASYHLWSGDIPSGSLARYSDDIAIALPWFELVRQSPELSMEKIAKELMRITSTFERGTNQDNELPACNPMITWDALERYVSSAKGLRGVSRVREALEWAPPNARSPREIDLTIALAAPVRTGGCGLPIPELNHKVRLGIEAARRLGKSVCYVDLFWEGATPEYADCGAEYLGAKDHPNIGPELTRVNALSLEGINLNLIANEQFMSAGQLLITAKRIARVIGYMPFGDRWPSESDLQAHISRIIAA